jgi:hypothetical protein
MRTKLIFSTEKKDTEYWKELPFIPRTHEWINVSEFLSNKEIAPILNASKCWSGERGFIESVEYRFDNQQYYTELIVWCEDR